MSNLPLEQRAGGIVYQYQQDQVKYLFVTSNSNRSRWIFPAGHVEVSETLEQTALREVVEEAGVKAVIRSNLGSYQYHWQKETGLVVIETTLFLMEYLETLRLNPEGRQVGFFSSSEIMNLKLWDESRRFFKLAEEKIAHLYDL